MATKNWNNDFMAKVLEEAAWKELSSEFAWNEPLLEKYKDKVSRCRGKKFPATETSFGLHP